MDYRQIFSSDLKTSALGVGTWVFGGMSWGGCNPKDSVAVIQQALQKGVRLIDTSPIYSDGVSEETVGLGIKGLRDKAFIATKCGLIRRNGRVEHDLSPESIVKECDDSLRRLQCDVIDLYQMHYPDPKVPLEKTMETLLSLKNQNKIRHIGLCNVTLDTLKQAMKCAPILSVQMEYSLLQRNVEKELLPFCVRENIGLIVYGALGGGILTGKYRKPPTFPPSDARRLLYPFYEKERFMDIQGLLKKMKDSRRPLNQIALNWCRQQRGVWVTLAGCRNPRQLKENSQAIKWDLTPRELLFDYAGY